MAFLIILLLIFAAIAMFYLVKALQKTDAPTVPKAAPKAPEPSTQLISTVGPKPSPQITVYTNVSSPNAFRCPVCDSKPAPSAKYCQVCGQVFQSKGAN